MSILKPGGRILSLVAGPNKQFAVSRGLPFWKTILFSLAGRKLDQIARKKDSVYRFIFVRADGQQLQKITKIVAENQIVPTIDEHVFDIDHINNALELVAHGKTRGKVVVEF